MERDLSLSSDKLDKIASKEVDYAKTIQDPEGRASGRALPGERFTSLGYLPGQVDQALDRARESEVLSADEMWVTIQWL